jgi:hypothetical protein
MRRLTTVSAALLLFVAATAILVLPAFADPIIPDDTGDVLDPVDDILDPVEDAIPDPDEITDPIDDVVNDPPSDDPVGDAVDDTPGDTDVPGDTGTDEGTGTGGSGGGSGDGKGNGGKGNGGKGGKGGGKDGGYGDLSWWTGMTPTYGMSAFDTRLVFQPFNDAMSINSTQTSAVVTDTSIGEVGGSASDAEDSASTGTSSAARRAGWMLPIALVVLGGIAFALFEPDPGRRRRETPAAAGS